MPSSAVRSDQFDPACLVVVRLAGTAVAVALTDAAAWSRLEELNLSKNRLGDATAWALGVALSAQGNAVSSPGATAAGGAGRLRRLNLDGNRNIGVAGARGLALGLRAAGSWLEEVNVSNTSAAARKKGYTLLKKAADAWHARCCRQSQHGGSTTSGEGSGAAAAGAREEMREPPVPVPPPLRLIMVSAQSEAEVDESDDSSEVRLRSRIYALQHAVLSDEMCARGCSLRLRLLSEAQGRLARRAPC